MAESDADYRKFYIENSSATVRLRAETKCASSLPAALLLQCTSSLFVLVLDCVICRDHALQHSPSACLGHSAATFIDHVRACHCAHMTGIVQCIYLKHV